MYFLCSFKKIAPEKTGAIKILLILQQLFADSSLLILISIRRKLKVYDVLSCGGLPILFVRWQFAYVYGNRERFCGGACVAGMYVSLFSFFYY
jgi:hypothetical protein